MFWAAISKDPEQARTCRKSKRFCEVHDPRDPKSKYRTDLRYKATFNRGLQATSGFEDSSFNFELPGPLRPDESMLRRLAYDRVHAGIRSYNAGDEPSFRERVYALHCERTPVASIAKALGTTRPQVCRAIRELRKISGAHQVRLQAY